MSYILILMRHTHLPALHRYLPAILMLTILFSCSDRMEPEPEVFRIERIEIDGRLQGNDTYVDVGTSSAIGVRFSAPVDPAAPASGITLSTAGGEKVPAGISCEDDDRLLKITPDKPLTMFAAYTLNIQPTVRSRQGTPVQSGKSVSITAGLDSADKFPRITDDELLTLVQKQTFRYFWDFGHPVSGMARDRSTSGHTVTTGGTGFGVMAMIAAVERRFVTRAEAAGRVQKIVTFLKDRCTAYRGAFAHWIDGETGRTIPFSSMDDGADLVETAFLMQGLLAARQYFDRAGSEEQLRSDITALWERVEWNRFRKEDGTGALYWHWSPVYGWAMNMPVGGWNECLIVYVLAASSPAHGITKEVYDSGWARNGAMQNGTSHYGYRLPLGEASGGPLFFAHYSFLGLNPRGLSDRYADYWEQNRNHALINYRYCVENPKKYSGYGSDCWGLTASDGNGGYSAHSPANDRGVIAPTAALASMPYTPEQSMKALRFYYYTLGNVLWKEYGFVDAFNLSENWFDNQFLAIDQGPVVVMMENYRTGLLWNLFMDIPEIREGLNRLGFTVSQ